MLFLNIISFVVLFTLTIFIFMFISVSFKKTASASRGNANLPPNYTLQNYTVEKQLDFLCKKNSDCTTPVEYLMMNRCPMTAICLNERCAIVCPQLLNEARTFFEQNPE